MNPSSKVIRPNESWKNDADIPIVAIARATTAAIGTPFMPQRVDSDASATTMTVAVLGCSNSRTMSGEKFVSVDCAQSIDEKRSPACQSRRPRKSKPEPCEWLRWSPMVTSRSRFRMMSSISVMSARLT